VEEHSATETATLNAGDVKAAPLSNRNAIDVKEAQTMHDTKNKNKMKRNQLVLSNRVQILHICIHSRRLTSLKGLILVCIIKGNLHNSQELVADAVSHCWRHA